MRSAAKSAALPRATFSPDAATDPTISLPLELTGNARHVPPSSRSSSWYSMKNALNFTILCALIPLLRIFHVRKATAEAEVPWRQQYFANSHLSADRTMDEVLPKYELNGLLGDNSTDEELRTLSSFANVSNLINFSHEVVYSQRAEMQGKERPCGSRQCQNAREKRMKEERREALRSLQREAKASLAETYTNSSDTNSTLTALSTAARLSKMLAMETADFTHLELAFASVARINEVRTKDTCSAQRGCVCSMSNVTCRAAACRRNQQFNNHGVGITA
ncbi:hypothetical protein CYMTET_20831, partial [Cymbomonas tetramitiformis]